MNILKPGKNIIARYYCSACGCEFETKNKESNMEV